MDKEKYQVFLKESLEKIQKAHRENYFSIFAGAGVSVDSGMPKWDKLIETIKKSLENNTDKDDFLTIAEKFYIQFGKDIYYQKIKELILDNVEPKEIHDKIVNLNIKNIVTTNWDNLFEKAINNNGRYFDIIRKDDNMGYATGYSKLIKMHGDLKEENIVFRETDYLEYSRNFPLIENYIKAIFSTDIVILVGYSLGDYNVKQILSWLRCSAKTKPIYFIKTEKAFESLEFEYYKAKNIYVLYLEEKYAKESPSQQLINFFEEIQQKNMDIKDRIPILSKEEIQFIQSMLLKFNHKDIQKEIEKIMQDNEITDEKELKKAFLLYYTQQYFEAYETLKRLSREAFRHRNHKIWYISEFNRKNFPFYLNNTLREEKRDIEIKKTEEYLKDARKINLEDNYLKLSINIREDIKPLTTLELDLCKNIIAIYKLKDDINRDHETYKNGGISINNNVDKLLDILIKIESQRIGFCLLYDYDEFFKNAMESIFVTLSTAFLTRDKVIKASQRNIENQLPERKIDDMIMPVNLFSYSIRYFETNKLKEVLKKYYRNDNYFIFKNQESLKVIFTNICYSFNYFGAFVTPYSRWFNNFLIISAWIKVEQDTFNFILDSFCDKLAQRVVSLNEYQSLDYFLVRQYSKNSTINFKKSIDLLITYMEKFCREEFGAYDIEVQNYTNLFSNISQILQKQKQHLIDNKHGRLIQVFIKTVPLIALAQTFSYFIMQLYDTSDKTLQDKISIAIKEKFETINDDKIDINKEIYLQFAEILKEKNILTQKDYDNMQNK